MHFKEVESIAVGMGVWVKNNLTFTIFEFKTYRHRPAREWKAAGSSVCHNGSVAIAKQTGGLDPTEGDR